MIDVDDTDHLVLLGHALAQVDAATVENERRVAEATARVLRVHSSIWTKLTKALGGATGYVVRAPEVVPAPADSDAANAAKTTKTSPRRSPASTSKCSS